MNNLNLEGDINLDQQTHHQAPVQQQQQPQVQPQPQGEQTMRQKLDLKKAAHPIACVFHVLFKLISILFYTVIKMILGGRLVVIIMVILCNAFDFWTVKNVTGRLLVGLKWWQERDENGKEQWKFECKVDEKKNNVVDATFFWGFQFAATTFWLVIVVFDIIGLDVFWTCIASSGFVLTGINLWSFYKCSREQKNRVKNLMGQASKEVGKQVLNQAVQNL